MVGVTVDVLEEDGVIVAVADPDTVGVSDEDGVHAEDCVRVEVLVVDGDAVLVIVAVFEGLRDGVILSVGVEVAVAV